MRSFSIGINILKEYVKQDDDTDKNYEGGHWITSSCHDLIAVVGRIASATLKRSEFHLPDTFCTTLVLSMALSSFSTASEDLLRTVLTALIKDIVKKTTLSEW